MWHSVVIKAVVVGVLLTGGAVHHHHPTIRQEPYCTVNRQLVVSCVGLGQQPPLRQGG